MPPATAEKAKPASPETKAPEKTAATIKEFVDIAESFRRDADADAEDANPTYKH